MDVTGTDPRARTGLFLWPWAATGYPNMPSSNAGPINPQSTPPLGLSSPPMSGGGGFEQGLQHQQQQQDTSLESFYSRLPYSAGGPVPSLQQMQQHQRQQREAAAAAAAVAVSEMQGINNQSGVNRMSATGQHQPPHAPPLAPPPPPPPPPPPFDQRTLMNGRQQQQQQPPTINSASSSPLNSGAYHNPPISPGAQQQQVSQQQFQRHYSSTGSLQNASSSPLDGRISSSASPSVSSAPSYCLKRPSNEFNSATAMALALQAVAKGDRQMQPPPPMHVPPSSSVAEHLQGGGGPGGGDVFASMNSNYLFQPSMSKGPGGGLHGRGSTEAAAMAAAMAAQAARDAANEMVVDPRSAAAGGHPLGLHAGGFLPDFLSGETKLDPTGGVGLRGGFGSVDGTPTMGGGLGMMDGLPGIYGHAAKGYKCKICQHVCFSRQDLSTHNSTTHKQDPRPYRCDQCGRQFSTCAYLSQHRRIHSGIKPYVCRYCDRKFTQLSHVQQHERIHTGEKPYKCATCFKSFTQMSNLQSHQRQHMKGKPHRCENCFMSYDTKEELDVHVQAKHSGNRYAKVLVCPACSKSYNSETYLAKHMERHKEAVTNANVGRFGALNTSAGALGALSGFMTGHHPGMGGRSMGPVTEQSLHEELQQRIGHPQDLQNLQRAAVAAAASIMSPMGPGSVGGLGGHDTSHLLHHLPSGLQGQLAVAQKGHQQGMHGGETHPGNHSTPGFPDAYQQHQMLAASSPYANQMPSFLGRGGGERHMPRFPPTPLDAGRKMMDFQPPAPPMAHQQMSLEHAVLPPPPQFQSPPPPPHQQMRPFGQSPQSGNKSVEGGKGAEEGGKEVNSTHWEQGPITPVPLDGQDDASGVSITGDEPGPPGLWTPHSSAKRLKPDPDERTGGYHQQQQQQQHQQPFETEYLRRSASSEHQYHGHQQPPQLPPHPLQLHQAENSMEHVVDKLAKFWQRSSAIGGAHSAVSDGRPGRDIRIEALLSGFPQNTRSTLDRDCADEEAERMRHMSQSSSRSHERDFPTDGRSNRPPSVVARVAKDGSQRGESGGGTYPHQSGFDGGGGGGGEDREHEGVPQSTSPSPYRPTGEARPFAYSNPDNYPAPNGGSFYGNDGAKDGGLSAYESARDLSIMGENSSIGDQSQRQQPNDVGFPVRFSSQAQ